jgi:hypothetical protein
MHKMLFVFFLFGTMCFASESNAQESKIASSEQVETVLVNGVKDPALMSYVDVIELRQEFDALKNKDKIFLRFYAEMKSKESRISDLKVHLEGENINQPVTVEYDGTLDLPVIDATASKNADIITNQKTGTLKIYYAPGIKVPEGTSFTYREVMDGIEQSTAMMKKFWNFLFPSFHGVSLRYINVDGQFAIIHSKSGDKKISIDQTRKSIALEYDAALYEENPIVTVSEKPVKISPVNVGARKQRDE